MSLTTAFYMFILFLAKVLDNTLNTAKTILVQRNRCLLAGVALGLSNFIYLSITKDIDASQRSMKSSMRFWRLAYHCLQTYI